MLTPLAIEELDRLIERKAERDARVAAAPELGTRLRGLRAWQARRLAATYDDLARKPATAAAVAFFLSDLYGPQNLLRRDADLARAWRLLRRTLPSSALEILAFAVELTVLTEDLDHALLAKLPRGRITADAYAAAYRAANRAEDRRRQIELVAGIGERLEHAVQHRAIGLALRAARMPARLAGFSALQDFLERGFAAFARMGGAAEVLGAVREREYALMKAWLSRADTVPGPPLPGERSP